MPKKQTFRKIVSASAAALVSGAVFVGVSDPCFKDVALESRDSKLCLEEVEYKNIKDHFFKTHNDKTKDYDFEINEMALLDSVFQEEFKRRGISNIAITNKEDLKTQLLNLLK